MDTQAATVIHQVLRLGVAALVAYLIVAGLMVALETRLLFPAPVVDPARLSQLAGEAGAQEARFTAEDGTRLYGWRLGTGDPLLLYFSGNATTVGAPVDRYRRWTSAGYSVLHVNFRGYPGSEGSPSERGLRMDARAAWQEARKTHDPDQIIIIGKSLGGGVAAGLAAGLTEQPRGLVLESTFLSGVQVASEVYWWLPVGLLMRNRFDTAALAGEIGCPTVVVHGEVDGIIGAHHGRELAQRIPGARYIEVAGKGHNDVLTVSGQGWAALQTLAAGSTP